MFNQYIALAKEYLKIHEAFTSTGSKYKQFQSSFIKQSSTEQVCGKLKHVTRYKLDDGYGGEIVYRDNSPDNDYDDSQEYNYISFYPGCDQITVFDIDGGKNEATIYPYELFADLDEELFFQYSTVYTERELKMLVLYWYFNKHCVKPFYLQLHRYDKICDIYNKTVEI